MPIRVRSPGTDLETVLSCRVGAVNRTQGLWKSSQVLLATDPSLQPQGPAEGRVEGLLATCRLFGSMAMKPPLRCAVVVLLCLTCGAWCLVLVRRYTSEIPEMGHPRVWQG